MKRKGFTLIELIAVLIILSILSLVVVPLMLNIIRNAKNSANKRSIDGYGRAVDLAIANYLVEHLTYPDTFDKLEIEYSGSKVECKTSRINPDETVYLSECKVNGRLVKDNKNIDGYYHYGILKMTNQEYVDTYGKNLEDALKKYHDEHNEYPSDYTTLELPKLDKEVSCDVDVNYDGTVYLNNCKVDNQDVIGDNNEVYVYGNLYATTSLLKKINSKSITSFTDGNTHEMYTFDHEATEQTPALTDYRYIGNEPYNYVKFNGNETWRIIGVFATQNENGIWNNRIKLIRNDSIGNKQWDTNHANVWENSSLQNYLNDNFKQTIISEDLIDKTNNYVGGLPGNIRNTNGEQLYSYERKVTNNISSNWYGYISLMNISDYIFTYGKGVDNTVFNNPPDIWMGSYEGNLSSGWLLKNYIIWTLSYSKSSSGCAFVINLDGKISNAGQTNASYGVNPVLYLKPDVRIKSGDGTIDNPYEFEL